MIENESAGEWHPGDGWKVLEGTSFSRHIGPFYYRPAGKRVRFCMKTDSRHDNSHERAHGGVVMSFADEALGFAGRWSRDNLPMFTIEFDCRFLDAILCGDVVEVEPEVKRACLAFIDSLCQLFFCQDQVGSRSAYLKVRASETT